MSSTVPTALLLDFGSVISKSLFETIDAIESAYGLEPDTLNWYGPFAPERDSLWRAMQAGEMSERNYWARRCGQLGEMTGQHLEMIDIIRASRGPAPEKCLRPQAIEAISRAKQMGARLGILSNELELFYGAETLAKISVLGEFEHIIDATTTDILKPDPRAYAMAREAFDLPAEQIVFVDDQLKNIQGGRAYGFDCIHFDVHQPEMSFSKTLSRLNVLATREPNEHAG